MAKDLFHNESASLGGWFRYHFLHRKLATAPGIVFLSILALSMSYLIVLVDYKLGIAVTAGFAVLMVCVLCIAYPFFGFYFSYIISLFLMFPARLTNAAQVIPTGLIPEYISYLTLLGVVARHSYRKEVDSNFWSSMITLWLIVQFIFLCLEVFNPAMGNKLGWFNFVRKAFSFMAFLYVSYCFFRTKRSIEIFTNFWIILCTIEAVYCVKQQWFGFSGFEYTWLVSDPKRYDLFVNYGFVRKFGLLSDPAAAGVLYACSTVFLLVLALRTKERRKQLLYYFLVIIHFLASTYTGTRTATLMIVAAVVFYIVLTLYEKKTIIFSTIFILGLVALLTAPIYDNMIINRLRSTFEGSKDPSAQARDINRALVHPYVYKHPIGGGLATAGLVGQTYNPGHYLSAIPPDSAYMQTMMEQGPIGLAILLMLYYIILRKGIKHFYRVRDPDVKTLYAAHLLCVFSLFIAQFSQLAIGQYPNGLYFYSAMAIFMKLHTFDSSSKIEETTTI
jgi:putative inorganic carbon (HCO3(-)) transporter